MLQRIAMGLRAWALLRLECDSMTCLPACTVPVLFLRKWDSGPGLPHCSALDPAAVQAGGGYF